MPLTVDLDSSLYLYSRLHTLISHRMYIWHHRILYLFFSMRTSYRTGRIFETVKNFMRLPGGQ